jgi:hypothetical protein
MANTIGFGQGAVNNTNGFGKAPTNNTIDFGEVCADSWSPETNLTGTGTGFSNTQSTEYDAVDDYVDLGSSTNLNFSGDFTISAWIKTDAIGSNQFVIDTSTSGTTGNGYALYIQTNGKLRFWSYNANYAVDSTTTLSTGTWYNVIVVFASSTNYIYLNGSLENTSSVSLTGTSNTSNLRIGSSSVFGGTFNGHIDEVALWSSNQGSNASTIGASVIDLSTYSPLSWYRFEGTGTSATDSGSEGNTGTLTNGVIRSSDAPT